MKDRTEKSNLQAGISQIDVPMVSDAASSSTANPSSTSVEEIFQSYYAYLKSYQPHSHVSVKKSKKYHKFFFGLEKITPQDIAAYQKKRLRMQKERNRSKKTSMAVVERELQHCHSAFTRAINAGLTDSNPFEKFW